MTTIPTRIRFAFDATNCEHSLLTLLNELRQIEDHHRLAHVRRTTNAAVNGFGVEHKRRRLKEDAGEIWWKVWGG